MDLADIESVKPVYETLPGWDEDIRLFESRADLPEAAEKYLAFVEDYLDVDIKIVSTGPKRSETIEV